MHFDGSSWSKSDWGHTGLHLPALFLPPSSSSGDPQCLPFDVALTVLDFVWSQLHKFSLHRINNYLVVEDLGVQLYCTQHPCIPEFFWTQERLIHPQLFLYPPIVMWLHSKSADVWLTYFILIQWFLLVSSPLISMWTHISIPNDPLTSPF